MLRFWMLRTFDALIVIPMRGSFLPRSYPRFLQIRLGRESCDQISASPNKPKRAKSRDKTAGSLFTRATLWLNSVKLKGVSFRFITKHTKTNDTSTSLSFTQHNSYFVKNKIIILFFLFFLLILLRSTNAIERRHWLLASVSIASVLSEHHLFVYVRHV